MTSLTTKPTIIFVPGAWHSPDAFKPTADILQSAGYQTVAIATPSVGASPALDSFDPDVEAIRKAVIDALNQETDVLMVFHSYGSVPGSEACRGLSKAAREAEGHSTGVSRLVYLASFIADEGISMMDLMGGDLLPWIRREGERGEYVMPEGPEEKFYNDLDEEVAREWVGRLKPHSAATFESRVSYAAWRDIPSTYIFCEKDAAIPIQAQEAMVQKAREATEAWESFETERLGAGHSPFLSMPQETADAIRRAAGETGVGMSVGGALGRVAGGAKGVGTALALALLHLLG